MALKKDLRAELSLFREVIQITSEHEEASQQELGKPRILELREKLEVPYPRITSREWSGLLPSEGRPEINFAKSKKYMYLESPRKGVATLPIAQLLCDFSTESPKIQIRLMLFHQGADSHLYSFGFRFETPGEPNGMHGYFHCQPIKGFDKELPEKLGDMKHKSLPWAPETQPAFPLDANSPTSLFLCLLVSLYGPPYLRLIEQSLKPDNKSRFHKQRKALHFSQKTWGGPR